MTPAFRTVLAVLGFLFWFLTTAFHPALGSSQDIPDDVLDVFDDKCAFSGCHAGVNAPNGLDMTEEFAYSALVGQPSHDNKDILRVVPGNPARSYLIMKIKGDSAIKGERMPKGGSKLSQNELAVIEDWISSLPPEVQTEIPPVHDAEAFAGLSLATLPTTATLEAGRFAYRIAHRWRGNIKSGFANFYGLDGGASMFTELLFALKDNITVSIGRANQDATFEFAGKWRFLSEKTDGSIPVSAALIAGLDWNTREFPTGLSGSLSRTSSQRFHWFAQTPVSKQLSRRFSLLLAPGALLNGNVTKDDESVLLTLGVGARYNFGSGLSLFVEAVPILTGAEDAAVPGGTRFEDGEQTFNDGFTFGLEKRVGGHVFHVYLSNSLGLASNHYMSGADFDALERDLRLGFNIYRTF